MSAGMHKALKASIVSSSDLADVMTSSFWTTVWLIAMMLVMHGNAAVQESLPCHRSFCAQYAVYCHYHVLEAAVAEDVAVDVAC